MTVPRFLSKQPWLSMSPITGSFYFSGPPEVPSTPLAAAPVPAPQPASPAPMPVQQTNEAQQVWGTIQNTTSVAVLERYIREFPGSFYADIARARLEELEKAKRPPLPLPRHPRLLLRPCP